MSNNKGAKVVINSCYGGFGLSKEAQDLYAKKKGIDPGEWDDVYWSYDNIDVFFLSRTDPALVETVQELKKKANGRFSELRVITLPKDVGDNWSIMEYDGAEWIAENHRRWS